MKRRAVTFTQGTTAIHTPQGIMQSQQEIVRVFSLDTTLETIFDYVQQKNATKVVVVFENEEPRET
jgi:hypothetical protein